MKLSVLGWYNHGNTGDEAYKLAFPLMFPEHEVSCVEDLSGQTPDQVILGGGDVMYPAFTKHLTDSTAPKRAMSITLTTNSDLEKLRVFEHVFVRDYRSLSIGQKHQDPLKVTYLPDFTFSLTPDPVAGQALIKKLFDDEGHDLYDKVVICVISAYMAFTGPEALGRDFTTFLKLSQDIAKVADDMNASVLFLPFSTKPPWDDRMSNAWVASRMKYYQKGVVVHDKLGVQDTLNVISAANAVVSSRLHSSIFSTICSVPFIDLTHHSKNLGFIETIEKQQWSVPLWEFSITRYHDLLESFLSRTTPDLKLKAFTSSAKDQLRNAALL